MNGVRLYCTHIGMHVDTKNRSVGKDYSLHKHNVLSRLPVRPSSLRIGLGS
jgi:hypothetical protein